MTRSHTYAGLTLSLFILIFGLYFSWYAIHRYETLNAYTADLSLIDQAMWNTLHGRFLEATWGDHQQPRLAEHFEPILVPLAVLFWLWDDVRVLLIAQAFGLAIGALPVYRLAREVLAGQGLTAAWLPLLFPLIYLLSPPLQAAAVADFHADPFAVAPFLLAFWYATQRRWGWMWFWAGVVMMVKETMPALVVMLGIFLAIGYWPMAGGRRSHNGSGQRLVVWQGLGLIGVGTAWFLAATFGIVAPLAAEYFGSEGPVYLANRFSTNPLDWPPLLRDPARLRYLGGLILTTGGLALLAPHYLLLGLPLFVANTFSNFPGQYSGEQHYSAPLVAVLIIAAIYGSHNLFIITRHAPRATQYAIRVYYLCLTFAFIIALIYQTRFGWTPLSRRAESYAVTTHTQQLPDLLGHIPDGAPISASAAVHPHLAHRAVAYTFPTVEDAAYILVDVTDVPGVHPNDVQSRIRTLLNEGQWRLLAATDGFILLKREVVAEGQVLPDAFYDFARAESKAIRPQVALDITFGDQIRLLGFEVLDDPFHRQTSLRFYWQALRPDLPSDLTLWPQFFDDFGRPLNDPLLQPMVASLWYPPEQWQAAEIITTETLPQNLGTQAHLAVSVAYGDDFTNPQARLPVEGAALTYDGHTWAQVASFERGDWALDVQPPRPTFATYQEMNVSFEGGLSLIGLRLPSTAQAHKPLSILLFWQADVRPSIDYTVFLHLLDNAGNTVAQNDARPFWLTDMPMSRWQPEQVIPDAHMFEPPLPPGDYTVRLGLYDWQTLERLPLVNGEDSVIIGQVQIE